MTKDFLYDFIRQHKLAVVSTVTTDGKQEAALVSFAVLENLEIIFDTVKSSRKYKNLINNPFVAVVICWGQ